MRDAPHSAGAATLELPAEHAVSRKVLGMLGVALTDFSRNSCPYVAAGIAYWTLFSLFPLTLAAISLLGFLYSTVEEQAEVVDGVINVLPVSKGYISDLIRDITQARGSLGVLAIAGFLWTGTAVCSAVRKGVNHAWHIGKPHYFLLERAIDLVMLAAVAVLAFIQVVFTANLLGLSTLAKDLGQSGLWLPVKVLLELLGLAVTFAAFMLLYRYVPNTRVVWRDLWPGALLAAVLFHVVKLGFTWYMGSFSSLNLVYGSLGAITAVLVWAYLSSLAIMLGAQVSYTYGGVFGSRAGQIVLPEPRGDDRGPGRGHGFHGLLATLKSWLVPQRERDVR